MKRNEINVGENRAAAAHLTEVVVARAEETLANLMASETERFAKNKALVAEAAIKRKKLRELTIDFALLLARRECWAEASELCLFVEKEMGEDIRLSCRPKTGREGEGGEGGEAEEERSELENL